MASPIALSEGPDNSGFGSAEAGYHLAPLQYLSGSGPTLLLNGQEVGEPGAQAEGYQLADGRTTIFDYWAMPEFSKWINGGRYDGGGLLKAQLALRQFYAALLGLCQDPSVLGDGYWGLKYFNRPERFADCPADLYSFARFQSGSEERWSSWPTSIREPLCRDGSGSRRNWWRQQGLRVTLGSSCGLTVKGDATFASPLPTPGGLPVTDFRSRWPTSLPTCMPSPGLTRNKPCCRVVDEKIGTPGRSHHYVQRLAIKYNASLPFIMRHPLNSHFFILTIKHNATAGGRRRKENLSLCELFGTTFCSIFWKLDELTKRQS